MVMASPTHGRQADDDDGDGSPDGCTDAAPVDGQCDGVSLSPPVNTDAAYVGGDALPDYLDLDSDADGINDTDEAFDTDDDRTGDVRRGLERSRRRRYRRCIRRGLLRCRQSRGLYRRGLARSRANVQDDDGDGTPNWTQLCGDGYVTAVPASESCDDGDGDDANVCNNLVFST